MFQAGQEHRQETRGPLVVIANYVFDSLPQDAFAVKDGEIREFRVTTSAAIDGQIQLSKICGFPTRPPLSRRGIIQIKIGPKFWSSTAPGFRLRR